MENTEQWTAGPVAHGGHSTHWELQRTSDITAEEGAKSVLENYPNQEMTASIWVKRECKVDYVSQCISEAFWNYRNHLGRILEMYSTSGTWVDIIWPFCIPRHWGDGSLGVATPLISFLSPETGKTNR